MRTAKELAVIGMYTALLIGGQFVLSFVSSIEIVTVLFLVFCYRFGISRGMIVATAFSLLRCFIFGFMVNVVILYLIYYNLFAIVFGYLGAKLKGKITIKNVVFLTFTACVFTILFTLIDDIITPLYYAFTLNATKAYFIASIPVMLPQIVCTIITCALFIYPLSKLLKRLEL